MANIFNLTTLSKNEEDYLKALFHITIELEFNLAGTNQLAEHLNVSPASVNSIVKKLKTKSLVNSERYGKIKLSSQGKKLATQLIRKHRLWETFLYEHLNFTWDEVHEVAEQLEHIKSPKLILQLDKFLGKPKLDPHGDVIPDENGKIAKTAKLSLSEILKGQKCQVMSVRDASVAFLQMVSEMGIGLNTQIRVSKLNEFDETMVLIINDKEVLASKKFAENVFVKVID